jgi:hypothetical protein
VVVVVVVVVAVVQQVPGALGLGILPVLPPPPLTTDAIAREEQVIEFAAGPRAGAGAGVDQTATRRSVEFSAAAGIYVVLWLPFLMRSHGCLSVFRDVQV